MPNPASPPVLQRFGVLFAFGIIAFSLAVYLIGTYPNYGQKLVFDWDAADYRYMAEKFWGIPFVKESYFYVFPGWPRYMDAVPLRSIFPGSYFLFIQSLVGAINPEWLEYPETFALIYIGLLKLLLVAAYLCFYVACQRRYGAPLALCALLILTLPVTDGVWELTKIVFLGEILLRIFFLLLLAIMVSYDFQRRVLWKHILAFAVILTLCAHTKAQWALFGAGISLCFVFMHIIMRSFYPAIVMWMAVAVFVPLSVLLVNALVWDYPTLSPGIAAHANYKSRGLFMKYVCEQQDEETLVFCNHPNKKMHHRYWDIYMGADVSAQAYRALDTKAVPYFMQQPKKMLESFRSGLQLASNYPGAFWVLRVFDYFTWLVLLMGLFHRQTFLLGSFGLGLWLIPALANVFASYVARYHWLMQGMPLMLAVIILMHFLHLRRQKTEGQKMQEQQTV
jgi:hypothetical protein